MKRLEIIRKFQAMDCVIRLRRYVNSAGQIEDEWERYSDFYRGWRTIFIGDLSPDDNVLMRKLYQKTLEQDRAELMDGR